MGDLAPVLGILSVFGSLSFLTWVIVDGLRRKPQLRVMADFHDKLLDRINNGKELAEFMDSPGGVKFIDSISTERTHPARRVLRAVQVGIVLCAAGDGLQGHQLAVEPGGAGCHGCPSCWSASAPAALSSSSASVR